MRYFKLVIDIQAERFWWKSNKRQEKKHTQSQRKKNVTETLKDAREIGKYGAANSGYQILQHAYAHFGKPRANRNLKNKLLAFLIKIQCLQQIPLCDHSALITVCVVSRWVLFDFFF